VLGVHRGLHIVADLDAPPAQHRPTVGIGERHRALPTRRQRLPESLVACPPLLEELRQARRELGAVGGRLFAADKNAEVPMDRRIFDKWLTVAEQKAKIEKLVGGLWHPYRRKWATERQHIPLKDVAAVGGWTDTETLLTRYQQADPTTMLAVMSEPTKVRELVAQG